jgi:hypothetical protein
VPTKPTDDDKVVIEDLEVFACFKEVESTTTTTPEGTTTTKATTTQFTTAETVVTTVASTFTPGEPTGEPLLEYFYAYMLCGVASKTFGKPSLQAHIIIYQYLDMCTPINTHF